MNRGRKKLEEEINKTIYNIETHVRHFQRDKMAIQLYKNNRSKQNPKNNNTNNNRRTNEH